LLGSAWKKCDYCNEDIPADMRRCPYCGSLLRDVEPEGKTHEPPDYAADNIESAAAGAENIFQNVSVSVSGSEPVAGMADMHGKMISQGTLVSKAAKNRISNGMKVFITIICTVIPGLGQLAGVIAAIVFMNDQEDADARSFGTALLISSVFFFIITCMFWFVILVALFYPGGTQP
jgi:hypothetical protein